MQLAHLADRKLFPYLCWTLGAHPDQVAIVPNASVGAYQVASTLMMGCRDRVITTAEAFPSIAHVWLSPIGRVQGPIPQLPETATPPSRPLAAPSAPHPPRTRGAKKGARAGIGLFAGCPSAQAWSARAVLARCG
jgi:hypothetical protein